MPSFEIDRWPAAVLAEYQEYELLEPFGAVRDNWHAAMLAHLYASAHTPKNRRPPDLGAFMYKDPDTAREERIAQADEFFDRMKHGQSR